MKEIKRLERMYDEQTEKLWNAVCELQMNNLSVCDKNKKIYIKK